MNTRCVYCDRLIVMMCRKNTPYCSAFCEEAHDPEAWAEKTKREPL